MSLANKMSTSSVVEELASNLATAAHLEHTLLNSYLVAAASLKCQPQDWTGPRGAIRFELVRRWKKQILNVCHEEMAHLNLVQFLLRGIGKRACFDLPAVKQEDGVFGWKFDRWEEPSTVDGSTVTKEMFVALTGLSGEQLKNFVRFESTDSLQKSHLFGEENMELYKKLMIFEEQYRLASLLVKADADESDENRSQAVTVLTDMYEKLLPAEPKESGETALKAELVQFSIRDEEPMPVFNSIRDFYMNSVLPLYKAAFKAKLVPYAAESKEVANDLYPNAQDSIKHPNAAEGLLPVGHLPRGQEFDQKFSDNAMKKRLSKLCNKTVTAVVEEILDEGEGFPDFQKKASKLVESLNGFELYEKAGTSNDDILNDAQVLRQSHLYKFCVMLAEFEREDRLSQQCGERFEPSWTTPLDPNAGLDMAKQFNASFLVMIVWLARMYEVREKPDRDKQPRHAIEMLATWPLMSLAIRPFLELCCVSDVNVGLLYRTEEGYLPDGEAQRLRILFEELQTPTTPPEACKEMDNLALDVLIGVAEWADESLRRQPNLSEYERVRYDGLTVLKEFAPQFRFREGGGYSGIWLKGHVPGSMDYSESLERLQPRLIYEDTYVLRLRFAGSCIQQLATDPDPPTDEVGCTGTNMLHSSDTLRAPDARFNRSIVCTPELCRNQPLVLRDVPGEEMRPAGIQLIEATFMGVKDDFYSRYQKENDKSSGDMLWTSMGGGKEIRTVTFPVDSDEAFIFNLKEKDGRMPYFVGQNHLVWTDSEPIDPFIAEVLYRNGDEGMESIFQREVYNGGKTFMEMTPDQRALSKRGAVDQGNPRMDWEQLFPEWAVDMLPKDIQKCMNESKPSDFSDDFWALRLDKMVDSVDKMCKRLEGVDPTNPQSEDVELLTEVFSLVTRVELIQKYPQLRKIQTKMLIRAGLNFGHTISGDQTVLPGAVKLMDKFMQQCGVELEIAEPTRDTNGQWAINYVLGLMDTDTLRSSFTAEMFVPVHVRGLGPEGFWLQEEFAVKGHMEAAALLLDFKNCFWLVNATHQLRQTSNNSRTYQLKEWRIEETTEEVDGAEVEERFSEVAAFSGKAESEEVEMAYNVVLALVEQDEEVKLIFKMVHHAAQIQEFSNFFKETCDLVAARIDHVPRVELGAGCCAPIFRRSKRS